MFQLNVEIKCSKILKFLNFGCPRNILYFFYFEFAANFCHCLSNFCQIVVKFLPNLCQIFVKLLSNFCQPFCQFFIKFLSNCCQIFVKFLPNLCHIFVRFVLNVCQDFCQIFICHKFWKNLHFFTDKIYKFWWPHQNYLYLLFGITIGLW